MVTPKRIGNRQTNRPTFSTHRFILTSAKELPIWIGYDLSLIQFDVFIGETYQLYAIYDGHHSPAVSNYLKLHLLQTIVCALSVGNDFGSAASLGISISNQGFTQI